MLLKFLQSELKLYRIKLLEEAIEEKGIVGPYLNS